MPSILNTPSHALHPNQVVNLVTNRVVKIVGKVENTERFLAIALYQARTMRHNEAQFTHNLAVLLLLPLLPLRLRLCCAASSGLC
jgi:hypothetical protein